MKKILILLITSTFLFTYCGKSNKTTKINSIAYEISMDFSKLNPEQKQAAAQAVINEKQKNEKSLKALFRQQINMAKYTPNVMFYVGCNAIYGECDITGYQLQDFKKTMDDLKWG